MDKHQEAELRSELKSLFRSKYNSEKWQRMLIDFFGAREIRAIPRELTSEHNDKVVGRELGKLSLPGFEIGLYEFEIKKSYRIAFNRVGLRSLVKSYTNYEVDAALVVYYSGNQWRLSYICDLRDEKTAPKRFTYLFGNPDETYRTPIDRFLFLKDNGVTLKNINDAFSVEKLTTDFFNGYKAQFRKFCTHIGGEEKWQRDYVKKLLGRLVFLQFLQKKGWMGVPLKSNGWKGGDPNYIRTLIDRHKGNDRLLTEVLEPLFFETLNQERPNDGVAPVLGDQIRIPYLNGGLFDRDELDRQEIDFPFAFFDDLIEFFSHYNFTIDENDPDDSDVGIDPEMLGHIFENLLEDNKDKGTFYTPKEIVQYMSRESLIQYLCSHTDASLHPAIERLIQAGEVEPLLQDRQVAVQIDDLLRAVKVCDPAIGSGAFPMGVLSEIFKCRRMLYGFMKNSQSFSPSQIKREIIQQNIYGVDIEQGAVDIARLRFWLSLVVDEEQPQPLPNLDYKIMQGNSLLESFEGIDLSKFAEEQQANGELFGSSFEAQTREAIEPLIKRHFSVTDHPEKELIRAEIDGIIRQHIEESLARRERELKTGVTHHQRIVKSLQEFIDNPVTTTANRLKYQRNLKLEQRQLDIVQRQLTKVADSREHIKQVERTNRPFFLWHLYFKDVFDQGGFDIVIANPPYVQLQGNSGFLAEQLEGAGFETFTRMGDLYCLFYEKGIGLLKEGGVETFITSSKWMRAAYGEKLRAYLGALNPHTLIELGPGVFDSATVDTNILIVEKAKGSGVVQTSTIRGKEDFNRLAFSRFVIPPQGASWISKSDAEISIDKKVHIYGTPLGSWDIKINFGVKTGCNDAFIIDGAKRADLIAADPKCAEIIRPLLRGKDVGYYTSLQSGYYLISTFPSLGIEIDSYPSVRDYLLSFGKRLHQTGEPGCRKKTHNEWFETQDPIAYYDELSCEKIIWKRIGSILRFCYDDTGSVVLDSTCFSSGPCSKYLTAVLNSKMGHYLLKDAPKTGTGDLLISVQALEPIAVPILSEAERKPFEELVNEIIRLKKMEPTTDTSALEAEIDRMVYDLYGLTEEEINIVEGREPVPEQIPEKKMKEYDFFISHATEDKNFVRPLAKVLKKEGCKVWYDEFEMKLGDSLRQKIDHGLANSRYGIVVISNHFINKNWTAYELNGMIAREIDGVKVVLPLWHNITKEQVIAYSPTLADKMALETGKHEIAQIVEKLKELLAE